LDEVAAATTANFFRLFQARPASENR
jgi:hypothetical protein